MLPLLEKMLLLAPAATSAIAFSCCSGVEEGRAGAASAPHQLFYVLTGTWKLLIQSSFPACTSPCSSAGLWVSLSCPAASPVQAQEKQLRLGGKQEPAPLSPLGRGKGPLCTPAKHSPGCLKALLSSGKGGACFLLPTSPASAGEGFTPGISLL